MQPGKQSGIRRVTSWQLLGAQLRHFRKLVGLTQAALAEQAGVGEDTIASIEQGRRALQLDLAIQLDELYPPPEEEEIEKRVTDRLDRQKILERKPRPILHFILEESILHTQPGDPEVMREQLLHLRRCMDLPFVTIQIMPRGTPRHAGLSGPLILLETPDHDGLAYIDGQLRGELYDEPADVSALMQRYGMLRSQALTVAESTGLLDALLGETCPAQRTPPPVRRPSTGSSPATATVTAEPASKSPPTPPPSTSATPR